MHRPLVAVPFLLVVLLVCGCGNGGDRLQVIDVADPGASNPGDQGPFGVGRIERRFRVRVDESVKTDVFVPLNANERPASGPFPPVVVVQGGRVDPDAYRWLYRHTATRGFVVVVPHHAAQLAIFSTGNGDELLEAVRRYSRRTSGPLAGVLGDGRALVAGHSLGGVVAAKNWLYQPESFSHLAMLASYPAESEDFDRTPSPTGDRVLSVIGSRDRRTENPVEKAIRGARRFQTPTTVAIIEGMNHYQWGDLPSQSQLSKDAAPTVDTDVARSRFLPLFDALLADAKGDGGVGYLNAPQKWPRGVVPPSDWNGEED